MTLLEVFMGPLWPPSTGRIQQLAYSFEMSCSREVYHLIFNLYRYDSTVDCVFDNTGPAWLVIAYRLQHSQRHHIHRWPRLLSLRSVLHPGCLFHHHHRPRRRLSRGHRRRNIFNVTPRSIRTRRPQGLHAAPAYLTPYRALSTVLGKSRSLSLS